jgi:RNA polymerase sigma-32 factor
LLPAEEEYMLAKRWREHADPAAGYKLVTSHLRLVAKIASGYRGYSLPLSELISEGNIGMMQAIQRFDPDRGFRLSTYAIWWIRAAIQQYILHSWSLVKIGTTAAQKKLFFNLRRLKRQLDLREPADLAPESVSAIAKKLQVREAEVVEMNRRLLAADRSLNAPAGEEGDAEWQDWLEDTSDSPEQQVGDEEELRLRRDLVERAMHRLTDREWHIIAERKLSDTPKTLDELAKEYGITRERVRQIEEAALIKLQEGVRAVARQRRIRLP